MAKHIDAFKRKNCELILIGSGAPSHINEFRKITGYKGQILTDPDRLTFKFLGLISGIGGLLGLKTITRGISAIFKGVKPGKLQGSALQLGGAVIIDKTGSLLYHFRCKEAGEDPLVSDMLAAVV